MDDMFLCVRCRRLLPDSEDEGGVCHACMWQGGEE